MENEIGLNKMEGTEQTETKTIEAEKGEETEYLKLRKYLDKIDKTLNNTKLKIRIIVFDMLTDLERESIAVGKITEKRLKENGKN